MIKEGAIEVSSYKELFSQNLDCMMMCVTNTPIAVNIADEIYNISAKQSDTSMYRHVLGEKLIKQQEAGKQ